MRVLAFRKCLLRNEGEGDTLKMKKKYIFVGLVVAIAGLLAGILIIRNEKDRQSPVDRYMNAQSEEDPKNSVFDEADTATEGAAAENETSNNFTYRDIRYEFLSYEIIEDTDIAAQTKYDGANFYSGELPDPNELEEYIDYDAIKAECPELKEMWETDKYTFEETIEIFNNNIDIVNKHTSMVHFKTRYIFINCQITNTSDKVRDVYMNEIRCILSSPDMEQYVYNDNMCYFDAPVYTQGEDREHSFFCYSLQPGETLDCTVGFAVKDEIENPEYYFGFIDMQLEMDGINPVKGKYVIKLSDLEEAEK